MRHVASAALCDNAAMSDAPASALLAVNLGTPAAPTAPAVRRYLAEFLGDRRVVDLPRWFWWPLLHGLILPLRSPRSARKYAQIWLPQGSPLAVHTQALAEGLQQALPDWPVRAAMRYGEPALGPALDALLATGARRIVVLPLYPQYSTTTTASVEDGVAAWQRRHPQVPITLVRDYADDPAWVAAVAASIRRWWQAHGRGEHLMFSFHGLPQRVADAGDPYPQRCRASAEAIAAALGLAADDWSLGYQSRFGRERWLQPYAEPSLWALAESGRRTIDVVCPGFACDCLETLEEVGIGFVRTVGERGARLRYIPCLNGAPEHARALTAIAARA